ncbi:glycerol-3-phosphate acyltransferase 2, mitochondrial isoform X2 [Gouania willdenowi]|nr:glycerol-3-phosphate acyltransferase 2, mitochondrial-like isoform X2 [Gouania willdenowi]XP_028313094.1 glycerol-3-phosphate acyltransferase 2, mitochondrial-like isoform X2 [Gouania willdenowi]
MVQGCYQCTPESLVRTKPDQSDFLGFRDLLSINEKQTRYRGWLVRRICCALFVSGCKVYPSPSHNRQERISNRVKEALAAKHKPPEGENSQGQLHFLPLINTCISSGLIRLVGWVLLKMFASMFGSVQVNLNHLSAVRRASDEEGSLLVYIHVRQSLVDYALIALTLFCHNVRVPYTFCPLQIKSSILRAILQKVGVVLLPPSLLTEQDAEMDPLHACVMTSLVRELLLEGQAVSVGVSAESGQGGQWLGRIRHLIKAGSVPDVSLVPVGISYDSAPNFSWQGGLKSVLQNLWTLLWRRPEGLVRIHFAQPFSFKEMFSSGRYRVDEWLPLQDLLLSVVLNDRVNSHFGQRRMPWLLSPSHYAFDHEEPNQSERNLDIAIILHLIFSAHSCMAVMSTGLVASLLLHKHYKGVSAPALCRDVVWLTEELLLRNKDVGFSGSLAEVVHYALSLLAPHLIMAAAPSRMEVFILPRPTPAATRHLSLQSQAVTRTFALEAVGACAVSAMLREVAFSGISSWERSVDVEGEDVKGDIEFDVVLCQSKLTEKASKLCHLLPKGFMPPCQSESFALDAVDSLVRCGILIMEEVPRAVPTCDFLKREGFLDWTTSDDPYPSDSDCEEEDLHSYKISQPIQCPGMLFFLCSMLAEHLRALCWAIRGLDHMDTSLPEAEFVAQIHSHMSDTAKGKKRHYESCSEEAARTAIGTLVDLGVVSEERQNQVVLLGVTPLFRLSENRQKLHVFVEQYLYN